MPRSHRWISNETAQKERDFTGLVGAIHIPICKAIHDRNGRPGDPPYLYIDLNGGPGHLRDDANHRFLGSPLIALNALAAAGLPYESLHFEKDPNVAAELDAAINPIVYPAATVYEGRFQDGVTRWLEATHAHPYRYGLVYSDPIEDPIPVDTFNLIADHFQRVDLLAYVAANNQYKRANSSGHGHGRRLAEDVATVDKKHVLIREPAGAEQYTFILFTNWTEMPAWRSRGFYELEPTGKGRQILDRLNYTKHELHERSNTPLPFDREPPYRTYREYLQHPRFKKIRAEVFRRAGGTCERCGQRPPTEPHHLRYPPWGTFDVPENMIAICHECHCEIHGKAS